MVPFDKLLWLARIPGGITLAKEIIEALVSKRDIADLSHFIQNASDVSPEIIEFVAEKTDYILEDHQIFPSTRNEHLDLLASIVSATGPAERSEREAKVEATLDSQSSESRDAEALLQYYRSIKRAQDQSVGSLGQVGFPKELWKHNFGTFLSKPLICAVFALVFDVSPQELALSAFQLTGRERKYETENYEHDGHFKKTLLILAKTPQYDQKYRPEIQTIFRRLYYRSDFDPEDYCQMVSLGRAKNDRTNYLVPVVFASTPTERRSSESRKEFSAPFEKQRRQLRTGLEAAQQAMRGAEETVADLSLQQGASGRNDVVKLLERLEQLGIGDPGDERTIIQLRKALHLLGIETDLAIIVEKDDPLNFLKLEFRQRVREIGATTNLTPDQDAKLRKVLEANEIIRKLEKSSQL